MKIRVMIAVSAAKLVGYICKKMGRQGVTWAGKVAIKICPDILEQLSSQVKKRHFCDLWNQWKNDHQQYALCCPGGRRTEGDL